MLDYKKEKTPIPLEELKIAYLKKYGRPLSEAVKECDSVFDLVYDLQEEFGREVDTN